MPLVFCLVAAGCSEEVGKKNNDPTGGQTGDPGAEISVDVPATGRAFVRLATPEVVPVAEDGASSTGWDLAFSGYDVFTNGGISGPGEGAAFGPLAPEDFEVGAIPAVPFLVEDTAGGAFFDWYAYDSSAHAALSRYHVHGVRDAGRTWKVQVLSYYGEVQGAPVSALYRIRYAEVLEGSTGPTVEITGVDGTAGGSDPSPDVPSECLDLASGERALLTPGEARQSTAWHLCFRRVVISVNGGRGGPRGVEAVDLDGAATSGETLEQVKARTADSEAPRFDAVGMAKLSAPSLEYQGDRVLTAFTDLWVDAAASPPALVDATWLVHAAEGQARFLVKFDRLEQATGASPGRVTLRVKLLE